MCTSMRTDKRHLIGKVCESSLRKKKRGGALNGWKGQACLLTHINEQSKLCVKSACFHSEFYHLAVFWSESLSNVYLACAFVHYDSV